MKSQTVLIKRKHTEYNPEEQKSNYESFLEFKRNTKIETENMKRVQRKRDSWFTYKKGKEEARLKYLNYFECWKLPKLFFGDIRNVLINQKPYGTFEISSDTLGFYQMLTRKQQPDMKTIRTDDGFINFMLENPNYHYNTKNCMLKIVSIPRDVTFSIRLDENGKEYIEEVHRTWK